MNNKNPFSIKIFYIAPRKNNPMKSITFIFVFMVNLAFAQDASLGIFDQNIDIGSPKSAGSSEFDAQTQTFTLSGGGYNIWFDRDEFHYLFNKITGDFIITANFEFIGEGKDPHRKVGL